MNVVWFTDDKLLKVYRCSPKKPPKRSRLCALSSLLDLLLFSVINDDDRSVVIDWLIDWMIAWLHECRCLARSGFWSGLDSSSLQAVRRSGRAKCPRLWNKAISRDMCQRCSHRSDCMRCFQSRDCLVFTPDFAESAYIRRFYFDAWLLLILGWIASCSASDSAYSYESLRSVVCLSVCRLSHWCTVLKPFDAFRCRLTGILVGSNDTLC